MTIICQNISKTFDTRTSQITALEQVSFEVSDGEFLCIVGPSGCGKTTLLKLIARLYEPTDGIIAFNGENDNSNPVTAMVFQEHGLFPWMNVIDNICFSQEVKNISKKERYGAAIVLLEKIGLSKFQKQYPYQLSAGMKQRVGLARALMSGARTLLMDEPFASLDSQMRTMLQEQLLEVHKEYGKTIIYVTHDVEDAVILADRVLLMTSRPGHIKNEIRINFPRPRGLLGQYSQELIAIKIALWGQIKEEVQKSLELH